MVSPLISSDPTKARDRLKSTAWPEPLRRAVSRLNEGGHRALLVGGSVRDALLSRPVHGAYDIATDLTPDRVSARFERVEPIGLAHGTVLLIVDDLHIECTTFRREGPYRDARHPDHVEFTTDPLADLARRDLTVNALAFDLERGELIDPFGGLVDLARGSLRAVGDPGARFREDALRPVRVARFAATLEMEVESATRSALGTVRDRAAQVAHERVRTELERLMQAPRPSVGLELLRGAGLLDLWMEELTRCVGVPQNRFHAHDVYTHSLLTCDAAPADKAPVRWAALLHDIGKPDTRVERNGEGTFYEHEVVGAALADRLLERLRFPLEERRAIVHLVREHMFAYRPEWSDGALRRWIRRVGLDSVADLFDLRIADVIGNGLHTGFPGSIEPMRERIEHLLAESHALGTRDLTVNGADVMRVLGVGPGPRVGAELEALVQEVLDHPERNDREILLHRLAERRDQTLKSDRDA